NERCRWNSLNPIARATSATVKRRSRCSTTNCIARSISGRGRFMSIDSSRHGVVPSNPGTASPGRSIERDVVDPDVEGQGFGAFAVFAVFAIVHTDVDFEGGVGAPGGGLAPTELLQARQGHADFLPERADEAHGGIVVIAWQLDLGVAVAAVGFVERDDGGDADADLGVRVAAHPDAQAFVSTQIDGLARV